MEPDRATVPIPGLMETEVAPEVVQESVLLCPFRMLVGVAENEGILGALGPPLRNATRTLTVSLKDDWVPLEA